MKTGPPRKPTRLRLLDGKRVSSRNEPRPQEIAPDCPSYLTGTARRAWNQLAPKLERLGLLTEIDGELFAAFCASYGNWIEARAYIKRHGRYFESATGYKALHPAVSVERRERELLLRIGGQFGLSPSSRAGIDMPTPAPATAGRDKGDKLEQLIARRQNRKRE